MKTTIFNEHCDCCDAPVRVEYHDLDFHNADCSCPLRLGIRQVEHEEFVRRIKAAEETP